MHPEFCFPIRLDWEKTIEACLILHRLLVTGRIARVLILVPEYLILQWFVEVLRKCNLWFNIFDEERCKSLEKGAPEGNPFLDDQLVICSIEFSQVLKNGLNKPFLLTGTC